MANSIIRKRRTYYDDGSFVEMAVWRLSEPVPPSVHLYKYSLVYIVKGNRILGYDNERGKGDHRHFGNTETAIEFTSLADLIDCFVKEVRAMREGKP